MQDPLTLVGGFLYDAILANIGTRMDLQMLHGRGSDDVRRTLQRQRALFEGTDSRPEDESIRGLIRKWQSAEERAHLSQDPEHLKHAQGLHSRINQHVDDVVDRNYRSPDAPSEDHIRDSLLGDMDSSLNSHPKHFTRQAATIAGMNPHPSKPNHYIGSEDAADNFHGALSDEFPKRQHEITYQREPRRGYVVGLGHETTK